MLVLNYLASTYMWDCPCKVISGQRIFENNCTTVIMLCLPSLRKMRFLSKTMAHLLSLKMRFTSKIIQYYKYSNWTVIHYLYYTKLFLICSVRKWFHTLIDCWIWVKFYLRWVCKLNIWVLYKIIVCAVPNITTCSYHKDSKDMIS